MPGLREATNDDRARLAAVHRRSVRDLASDAHSAAEIEAWASFPDPDVYPIDEPTVDVLVAEAGPSADGTATADPGIAGFAELDRQAGEITRCYVAPEHAGAGVGRALLERLVDRARTAGIESLYVESSRNAAGFYEHMGFERTGTHTKSLAPDGDPAVETTVVDLERSL